MISMMILNVFRSGLTSRVMGRIALVALGRVAVIGLCHAAILASEPSLQNYALGSKCTEVWNDDYACLRADLPTLVRALPRMVFRAPRNL